MNKTYLGERNFLVRNALCLSYRATIEENSGILLALRKLPRYQANT